MKKMKKLMALLMTVAMVMGMAMTTMAAETPTPTDVKNVIVKNVEPGALVTAYQIIEGKYNEKGFIGYKWAAGIKDNADVQFANGNVVGLTSELITNLSGNTETFASYKETIVASENTEATLSLNAGTWMIIVTPPAIDAQKVYNPMIASVYYSVSGSDNTMSNADVDANTNWSLETTGAYAKSTEITVEKEVDSDDKFAEVGEAVDFTIKTTIPSYSAEYQNVTFKVTDTISKGLKFESTLTPIVKVNNTELTNGEEYRFNLAGKTFSIEFAESYIKSLADKSAAARAVEITYQATVTEEAIVDKGINEAKIEYTNKPGEETSSKTDTEHTFTFTLDGVLQKVDDKDNASLAGAEFTLYRDEQCTDVFKTYTTTTDGDIEFKGLDADVIYYLKETKAPEGYSLNDHVYKVEIKEIKMDENGDVESYKVFIDGTEKATIIYGNPANSFGDQVINTKLSSLPSTGGIGTTIFTIGGCVIMIVAAGLFFASRRKENQ